MTDEFLADKPTFATIAEFFVAFIADAPLVIHNAMFDLKFLNAELLRLKRSPIPAGRAIDTIEIAKAKIPGARYSLDELCRRFGIDLSARTKHGALLDAELTARLYLELVGGRQTKLELAPRDTAPSQSDIAQEKIARPRPQPLAARLTDNEAAAHAKFVAENLGSEALWNLR